MCAGRGRGAGHAATQRRITQPRHGRRRGDPAAGFVFSLPVLMSAISMENVNPGRGPKAGDTIVLASALAFGDPALPGLSPGAHRSWGSHSGASTQPTTFLGWDTGPGEFPAWPALPFPSRCFYQMLLSSFLVSVLHFRTRLPRKEGREGGGGRVVIVFCVCAVKIYVMILALFK